MSAPIDAVITALNTIQAVSGKVYHAEALKNASAPFLFWLQDGETAERDLSGYTELCEDGYELHCVAKNLASLNGISKAAKAAVLALQGTSAGGYLYESIEMSQVSPTLREVEVGLYRKVYSLTINYQELEQSSGSEQNQEE